MKLNYLEQFTNENIKILLSRREIFILLEAVLAEEKIELDDIEKQKSHFNFGKSLKKAQIRERFDIISKDVNNFLGVSDVALPKLEAFTLLDPSGKHILKSYLVGACWIGVAAVAAGTLRKVGSFKAKSSSIAHLLSRRAFLVGGIASFPGFVYLGKGVLFHKIILNDAAYTLRNQAISYSPRISRIRMEMFLWYEYTHYLQYTLGFHSQKKLSLLSAMEGHARGVDEYMSRIYTLRYNNKVYRYHYLTESIDELQSDYLWLGQKLGLDCRKQLLGSRNTNVPIELSHYSAGHGLFSIYRHTQGEEIYNKILFGDFDPVVSSSQQ